MTAVRKACWLLPLCLPAAFLATGRVGSFPRLAAPPAALPPDVWAAKIHAGWVGKVAAGSGALPTELWPRERIREKYGTLTGPPQQPTPRGPLDDTTLAFLDWCAAREHGAAFSAKDIAREWVEHLSDADLKGGGYGQEFLAVLSRLRNGETPPIRTGSPREEWIAAQMRAEIWGMLAPGDPDRAADYAARDAGIFNAGNGLYAARFAAALSSLLMADPDIPTAIDEAARQIPADSELARLIADTTRWHAQQPADWEQVWQTFVDGYRDRSLEQRFAAWSPEWLIETGGWPEAEVLGEYRGRKDVLRTHPFGDVEPARLTAEVSVPPSGGSLKLCVTCNDRPPDVDWLLRVRVGDVLREEAIRWVDGEPRWQEFTIDLQPWSGKSVTIVLGNAVLGKQAWEAGYWTVPELIDGEGDRLQCRRPAGAPYRYPVEFRPKLLPETFSVLLGLLYGDGDFARSVSLTTMCGFDTDCNAGTVGCLLGLRNGLAAIPAAWREPLGDTYELQVTGYPRQWRISELAEQMAETGAALAQGAPAPSVGGASTPGPPASAPGGEPQGGGAVSDPPEGFGANARGGEGGRTITVTTLADSGPGSLREALAAQGPRTVRFAVEGPIELESRLRVTDGRVTIDGSTAPGSGITLLNHGIQFRGDCDDIIARHLRIRVLTGGDSGDCLLFWGNEGGTVERALIDHCSLMWATDEVVNTWGEVRDLTCQWTIIAEGQGPHSKAWLSGVGSDRISIHHCLLAHNADRNPKLEGGLYDVVNNVIYNWAVNNATKIESGARANVVGNYFVPGPQSAGAKGCAFPANAERGTKLYLSGNVSGLTPTGAEDQWLNVTSYDRVNDTWVEQRPAPDSFRADGPFPTPGITTQPAQEAYDLVLARAGAMVRDEDDLRVIREVKARTGSVGRGPR